MQPKEIARRPRERFGAITPVSEEGSPVLLGLAPGIWLNVVWAPTL
jgi:hypothetical protein